MLQIDKISNLTVFNTEINEVNLQLVPKTLMEGAIKQINKVLNTTKVHNALQERNPTVLSYEISLDKIIIRADDTDVKVSVNSTPFEKIYEYLQRINMIQTGPFFTTQQKVSEVAKKTGISRNSVNDLASAGNVISIVRNGLTLEPTFGPRHMLVAFLGTISGVLSLVFGVYLLKKAYNLYHSSKKVEDRDGENRAIFLSFSGINTTFLGTSSSVEQFYRTVINSQGGTFFAQMIAPLYIISSLFGIGYSSYCLHKLKSFKNEFNFYFSNYSLTPENRLKSVMRFLKDQIEITDLEKYKITQLVKSKKYKDKKTEQRIIIEHSNKLLEKKLNIFKRNTNSSCLNDLRNFAFDKLYTEDPETMNAALKLCQKITDVNNKKFIQCITTLAISIIGVIAGTAFLFTPIVILPAILMIVSSVLWLAINHKEISQKVYQCILNIHKKIHGPLHLDNPAFAV